MSKVIGIDIGGTLIKGAVVDENGKIWQHEEVLTQVFQGKEAVISRLKKIVDDLILSSSEKIIGIGLGSPGPIDLVKGAVINPPNLPGWKKVTLAKIIKHHAKIPTFLNNDANLATLGESWLGAGMGAKNLVMLTLGTGIGGGALVDGQLLVGKSGMAAEFGHMILDPQGPACGCGQRGCLESLASATRIEKQAKDKGLKISESREVFTKAREGNKIAKKIIDEMSNWLSLGIANLINAFDPEIIIIGGGLIKSWDLFGEKISQKAKKQALAQCAKGVQIVPAKLGDQAGILGAAKLALESGKNS